MSYLIGCCPRNDEGQETYYSNGEYVCGYCGATEEDDGEDPNPCYIPDGDEDSKYSTYKKLEDGSEELITQDK